MSGEREREREKEGERERISKLHRRGEVHVCIQMQCNSMLETIFLLTNDQTK